MTKSRSICIVADELAYLFKTGGIGTCNWQLASMLGREGWNVHILFCRSIDDEDKLQALSQDLAKNGGTISVLDRFELPAELAVDACNRGDGALEASDKVRSVLERLHAKHGFDLIEFADYRGLGFRSIQAKRAGLSFRDVGLIVKLHGSSRWSRQANHRFVSQLDDFTIDYCERYSFENADFQIAPTRYMAQFVETIGWKASDSVRVLPPAYPDLPANPPPSPGEAPQELVFFGRLETRKGLELFIDAVRQFTPSFAVTFLGKQGVVSRAIPAVTLIKQRLPGRQLSFLTDLDQEQAINYLTTGGKLAVVPSLIDNLPNTVIECAINGIPVVASSTGGTPELICDRELAETVLFKPTVIDLTRCLQRYLALTAAARLSTSNSLRVSVESALSRTRLLEGYEALVAEVRNARTAPNTVIQPEPPVTVAVVCSTTEELPHTLRSLSCQTYSNFKIVVVTAASLDRESTETLREQRTLFPSVRFVQSDTSDFGAQLNRALEQTPEAEYLLPLNAGAIARQALMVLVKCLQSNQQLAAAGCYQLGCRGPEDLHASRPTTSFRPTGGPHAIANLQNIYGTVAMFRVASLRDIGGIDPGFDPVYTVWDTCMRLVKHGSEVDVVPEHLFSCVTETARKIAGAYKTRNHILRRFDIAPLVVARKESNERLYLSIKRHLNEHANSIRHYARLPVDLCPGCGSRHKQLLAERVVDKLFSRITRLPR